MKNKIQIVREFTHPFLAKFQHNVNVEWIVKETMKSNYVGMAQRTMYLNLLAHLFLLVVFGHQFLGHNFAGPDTLSAHIDDFVAFCEASLKTAMEEDLEFNMKDRCFDRAKVEVKVCL